MTLFAIRPILHGEEITVEYTKLAESRQTRRERLLDMYYFRCECESCNIPDSDVATSDANRLELGKWSQTKFRSPREWCKNLSLPDSYLVDGYTRCISLHETEGIINMEYAMHVAELAIVYGMLADAKNFRLWGLKAQNILWGRRMMEKARR